jgi:hypothetical protein
VDQLVPDGVSSNQPTRLLTAYSSLFLRKHEDVRCEHRPLGLSCDLLMVTSLGCGHSRPSSMHHLPILHVTVFNIDTLVQRQRRYHFGRFLHHLLNETRFLLITSICQILTDRETTFSMRKLLIIGCAMFFKDPMTPRVSCTWCPYYNATHQM